MLEAKKSSLFERIFSIYNRNLLHRRFNSVQVSGFSNLLNNNLNLPTVIYCNHSSWWDGLIAHKISDVANLDSFFIMEEKHLKKHSLFRRLGAFSVVRENPREALESLKYSANLLNENGGRTLWIFPQGEILPNDVRPIFFYNGISRIIEKVNECRVIPIAFRYEFLGAFKPNVFVKVGEETLIYKGGKFNKKEFTRSLSENLTSILDNLKVQIVNQNYEEFEYII